VSNLSVSDVRAVSYNKHWLCAIGSREGSLDGTVDRMEHRTGGQSMKDIPGIGEAVTTLRQGIVLHLQGGIKGVRRLG
jgi:hypothetical protein